MARILLVLLALALLTPDQPAVAGTAQQSPAVPAALRVSSPAHATPSAVTSDAARKRHKRRQKRKQRPTVNEVRGVWNGVGASWDPVIAEAIALYPKPMTLVQDWQDASILIIGVRDQDMLLPEAMAETAIGGNVIRINLDRSTIPSVGTICHELTHVYGYDHGGWEQRGPCPHPF